MAEPAQTCGNTPSYFIDLRCNIMPCYVQRDSPREGDRLSTLILDGTPKQSKLHRFTETNDEGTPRTAPDPVACFRWPYEECSILWFYREKCRNSCQDPGHKPVDVARCSSPNFGKTQLTLTEDASNSSVVLLLLPAMLTLNQHTLGEQTPWLS